LWALAAFLFRSLDLGLNNHLLAFLLYESALILPVSFLVMTLTFLPESWLNKRLLVLLTFEVILVSIMTAIPGFVIADLRIEGGEKILGWGKGYFIYVLHQVAFFSIGYGVMFIKFFRAQGIVKRQIQYVILGTILPANLALLTNLLLPWFGIYHFYTWLGQIFMIFIVIFSGYAILKHHLFDIKVIATEMFVLATATTLLVRFFLSSGASERWIGGILFVAVSVFGVLLVKSVWREVEQRERLQVLTKQLEEANNQLKVLDKARAEFISIASHQLRTPPATIKWYVSSILSGDFGQVNEEMLAALKRVEMTNNSQISLIDDLLNASRIERGKLEFFFELGDLQQLTEVTVEQLRPQAEMKKLRLVYQKPTQPLPPVTLDKEKVRQVINNFIDNAIKYTKEGIITVFLEQTATDLTLKVKDTGRGVDPAIAPTLFEKYKRGKDSATAATGLGLGLYVAKVIIEQNKGKIWVESEGEGKGSTFAFSLPLKSTLKPTSVVDLTKTQ
jgi:signal transduction histidine kinase